MVPPTDADAEERLVPVSALQHWLFCPRQCALIHVERAWAEDTRTIEGRFLHERIDGGKPDRRLGIRTVRSLYIRSLALGVVGKADAVEFHGKVPFPIEYKRGRPKQHRADEVQLCAQALCLEEMFEVAVPEGALFYGETRRRMNVAFDPELRALTADVAAAVRRMLHEGLTPPPVFKPGCRHCSLHDQCRPEQLERPIQVARWLAAQLRD